MSDINTVPDYPRGLTFEHVWAALMETRKLQEETARFIKEVGEQQKETDKQLGRLGNRMGEVVEYMVVPNLVDKFRELGFDFTKANQNTSVSDRVSNIFFEIDVFLENGDIAMLVEVKTKLTIDYIKSHIEQLEKMRIYSNRIGDKRIFLGAVAGAVIPAYVKKYALGKGLYVIEPSGDTFNIIQPIGEAREW